MIGLNLLPPQEKRQLALEESQRWIMFYGSSILAILLILTILLGTIWFSLKMQTDGLTKILLQNQSGLKGQNLKVQQQLIEGMNKELKAIDTLQKSQKKYSVLLIALAKLVPDGVTLKDLSIGAEQQIDLSGHAQNRDDLLIFKEALQSSSFFENVESPLENLVKQTNIDFVFHFKLRSDAPLQ